MTLTNKLKKNSSKVKKVILAAGITGAVTTIAYLAVKVNQRTEMLNAAMDVIEDFGGDASELIVNKIVPDITK